MKFTIVLVAVFLLGSYVFFVPAINSVLTASEAADPSPDGSITLLRYFVIAAPLILSVRVLLPAYISDQKRKRKVAKDRAKALRRQQHIKSILDKWVETPPSGSDKQGSTK